MTAEHEFGKYRTQGDWDRVVFDNAVEFAVFVPNVGKWSFKTFADAVLCALQYNDRAIVYAISASERSVCVPKATWNELLTGIRKARKARKVPCEICGASDGKITPIGGRHVHASCWRTERMNLR